MVALLEKEVVTVMEVVVATMTLDSWQLVTLLAGILCGQAEFLKIFCAGVKEDDES